MSFKMSFMKQMIILVCTFLTSPLFAQAAAFKTDLDVANKTSMHPKDRFLFLSHPNNTLSGRCSMGNATWLPHCRILSKVAIEPSGMNHLDTGGFDHGL